MRDVLVPYLETAIQIWRYDVAGVTAGQLLLAVLALVIAVTMRRLFGSVVLRQLR
ncbi:hypothetical protein [Agrobacterium sp. T29]|uniref:hypothetical protein n=1 Tax=Agrobacterium sp. T29 TaxID=2580515 RepID=UPI00143D6553|nr:hypothetical protein [Agrobacterium sp. T29]